MRTLQLLVRDWRERATLLYARGPNRVTYARQTLVCTCLLAMAWSLLAAINANPVLVRFFALAVGIAFVVLATMLLFSATRNWRLTRHRTITGLGWTLLLLMGLEFVFVGLALRQWPWVLAGSLIGGSSINFVILKFEASLTRARQLQNSGI